MFSFRCAGRALTAMTLVVSCSFEDPNAPPPQDPCLDEFPASAAVGLAARIDGPASCEETSPPTPDVDTYAVFTGAKWNEGAALCRARDLFLGKATVYNADCSKLIAKGEPCAPLALETTGALPAAAPSGALGYCTINKGTPSEVVVYALCGAATAGEKACEETLADGESITADWVYCPDGPLCPFVPDEVCLRLPSDGSGYVATVDNPALSCGAGSLRADDEDSLFVTLSSGYGEASAVCLAASVYDPDVGLLFGIGPVRRYAPSLTPPGVPQIDPGEPSPVGAKGYCAFHEGGVFEYAVFTMCDDILVDVVGAGGAVERVPAPVCAEGAAKKGCICRADQLFTNSPCLRTPPQICEQGSGKTLRTRPTKWYACPGSPYCL